MEGKYIVNFDHKLLNYLQFQRNDDSKLLLNEYIVKKYDRFGTLLHYAAAHGNPKGAQEMIELGSDVNSLGLYDKTPLMLAVQHCHADTVRVLLEANADMEVTDANGQTALKMAFERECVVDDILQLFLKKLQSEVSTTVELVAKLIAVGCTLYHAAHFNDFDVLKCMIEYGVNIDSRGQWGRTALYAAAELHNLALAKWLIDNGADVNALDVHGNGPLLISAWHADKEVMGLLLENGADPNIKTYEAENTPLFTVITDKTDSPDVIECLELLLFYGAIPYNRADRRYSIFDRALMSDDSNRVEYLVAHLVILEKIGTFIEKSVKSCKSGVNNLRLNKYYILCEEVLEVVVVGNFSLLQLLIQSESKMRICVRNEIFLSKIEEVFSEMGLRTLMPYYYHAITKRIANAIYLVKLENIAIPIVCSFLNGNENEYYIAARKIVDYLSQCDLEQLILV